MILFKPSFAERFRFVPGIPLLLLKIKEILFYILYFIFYIFLIFRRCNYLKINMNFRYKPSNSKYKPSNSKQ